MSGAHAYVAGWNWVFDCFSDLSVIDVSTPSAPVEVGSVVFQGVATQGVAVSDDFVYFAGIAESPGEFTGRLQVIDVSNPSDPVEVGTVDFQHPASAVAVVGSHAYVVNELGGLRVIDVSTPSAPVEVGFDETPFWPLDVAVRGRYAFVVGEGSGRSGFLQVVDVSTPSEPTSVASILTYESACGVAVSGSLVFVATDDWPYGNPPAAVGGLRVYSINRPSSPVEIGFFDMSVHGSNDNGVAASDNAAFSVTYDAGFRVFDIAGCAALAPSSPAPRRPGGRISP